MTLEKEGFVSLYERRGTVSTEEYGPYLVSSPVVASESPFSEIWGSGSAGFTGVAPMQITGQSILVDPIGEMWAAIRELEETMKVQVDTIMSLLIDRLGENERLGVLSEGDALPDGYRLKRPIPVLVRTDKREVWVSAIGAHGQGKSEREAKKDLWDILTEDFRFLSSQSQRLGHKRLQRLAVLKAVMEDTHGTSV